MFGLLHKRATYKLLTDKVNFFLFYSKQRSRKKYENRNILNLRDRGMFEQLLPDHASQDILDLLNGKPQCVYAGFDPTANSLHIGNLLILINLIHWQRAGHQVIAVVGGSTALIGDPTGRTKDREKQEVDLIKENSVAITKNIMRIFAHHDRFFWSKIEDASPLKPVKILNNESWYQKTDVVTFISTIGRYFRMGRMLLKESVAKRLESERGMSFAEFTYQIFQAYDWLYLLQHYDCYFQIGGKDQLGNISAGRNLIDRHAEKRVFGLMLPLITTDAGDKFGKSVPNAVWLNETLTSPFEMYQFFARTTDDDVERLLKLFTFISLHDIKIIMKEHAKEPHKRKAQTRLAEEVVLLVHGDACLTSAREATNLLYNNNIESLTKLSIEDASKIFQGAEVVKLTFNSDDTVLKLALNAGCFRNEVDAIRIIEAGGFYINYKRVINTRELLTNSVHILPNKISLLRVGKRNFWIVQWI